MLSHVLATHFDIVRDVLLSVRPPAGRHFMFSFEKGFFFLAYISF